jgi:outer membrane protein TolC
MKQITLIAFLCGLLLFSGAQAMTLDIALAIAKQRSLTMQVPRIDRTKVDGRITEAWSNALPQVQGNVGYQRAWKAAKVFFPNPATGEIIALKMQQDNAVQADVTLNQPLYTFGRIGAGLKGAFAAKRANDHFTSNTSRAVELDVLKKFWGALLMRDVLEARRVTLAISDSSLTNAMRLRDVGMMSDYDVLRVQVQAMNQRPPLQQAENGLRLAELALKDALGILLDTSFTIEGSLDEYTQIVDTADASRSVLQRDDLEALRDLVTMQKNIYTIYKNAVYPTIGGQIKYAWQWQNDAWDINPRNNLSSVYGGVAVSIPIWTSGADGGRAKQYRADWQKAQLDLYMAERGATMQYESAMRTYNTARSNEEAAALALSQAEQARRLAQTKFEQGQLTPLEMDAVQLDEFVARTYLAQSKYDRLVAGAETRMALGLSPYSR